MFRNKDEIESTEVQWYWNNGTDQQPNWVPFDERNSDIIELSLKNADFLPDGGFTMKLGLPGNEQPYTIYPAKRLQVL